MKTDEGGNKIWDVTYGGSGDDNCSGLIQTTDGNYLLFGSSDSPQVEERPKLLKGRVIFGLLRSIKADRRFGIRDMAGQ